MVSSVTKDLDIFLIDLHVTPENKKHIYLIFSNISNYETIMSLKIQSKSMIKTDIKCIIINLFLDENTT